MKLLTDEKLLFESDSGGVSLSTHRVRYESKRPGEASFKSIMLDQVSSCSINYTSYPILLILAILFVLGGAILYSLMHKPNGLAIGIVIAVIFIIAYFMTRKQVISIASPGDTIKYQMSKLSLEKGKEFIDELEKAKDQRYFMY